MAIVTGAAGAIGGAVAEQLLRNGASVCICDIGGIAKVMGGEDRDGASALEQRRDELAAAVLLVLFISLSSNFRFLYVDDN